MLVEIMVDENLAITCHPEPVKVPFDEDEILFKLETDHKKYQPKDLKFVGFVSPQDLLHKEFEVKDIYRDSEDGLSTMKVKDKHKKSGLFRYEVLFAKENTQEQYDLYNFDPQIINLPD